MKNIFAINRTDGKNEIVDGASIASKKVSDELQKEIDDLDDKLSEMETKVAPSKLNNYIGIAAYFIILISLFFILGNYKQNKDSQFIDIFLKCLIPFILIIISVAAIVVIKVLNTKKINKIQSSDEYINLNKTSIEIQNKLSEEMGIPDNASRIDILSNVYKIVGGNQVPINKMLDYVAVAATVFVKDNDLCLFDNEYLFAIPIEDISIKKYERKIKVIGWNKPEKFKRSDYSKYSIRVDQMGIFQHKYYFQLEFKNNEDNYAIVIPVYEIDSIQKMINKDID